MSHEQTTGGDVGVSLRTIESHGVDYIPESERYSTPGNVVRIFIGGNLALGIIVLGWLPVVFGLSWWSSLSSILVGNALGAVILAPVATMGPRTGTNGPVSSGAYFGVVGRIIGSLTGMLISVGYFALAVWTGGQAAVFGLERLTALNANNVSLGVAYAVIAVIAISVAIYGHAHMVVLERLMVLTMTPLLIVGVFVFAPDFDASYAGGAYLLGSYWSTWTLSVMFFAIVTFTYAFWVNDWTRYISRERWSDRSVMWAAAVGSFSGLSLAIVFGAYTAVAISATGLDYVPGIVAVSSTWYLVPLILIGVVGSLGQGTVDIYSTGLDFSSIFPWLSRVAATIFLSVLGLVFVFLGTMVWDAEAAVNTFIALLGVFAAAWIGVVLVGHFQRGGYYDPDALQVFNRRERGGIYWFWNGLNPRGCLAWAAGSVVGLLFLNTSWYTGAWSGLANGLDLSWLSAMVIAGVLYLISTKVLPEPAEVYGDETTSSPARSSVST